MPFGTLRYNDYDFGDYTITKAQGTPVYDDAGMTIVQMRWVFTASSVITRDPQDLSVEDHFLRVRQQLEIAGQEFEIADKGFGPPLTVNSSGGGIQDVDFGPKPQVLSWVPIGHTQSVEFVWSVEVNLPPECAIELFGVTAFNYTTTWNINNAGASARTIAGYLEIALTRNGVAIPDNADNYRDLIVVNQPENFSRIQTYDLSADGKRLTFTIVDTEIESSNAYPAGVTEIDADHRVTTDAYRATAKNTLSVSLDLQQTRPRSDAWEIFRSILATRTTAPKTAGLTVMIRSLEIVEPLFGTRFEFTVEYDVIASATITDVINDLGLYETLGLNWADWATSMTTITGNRGLDGMSQDDAWKKIVDQCNPLIPEIGSNNTEPSYPPEVPLNVLSNDTPAASDSYILWDAVLSEDTSYNKLFARELGPVEDSLNLPSPNDPDADLSPINGLPSLESTTAQSAPAMYWRWTGTAQRLGYPIPTPDISSVGGVFLEKVGQNRLTQRNLGNYFGVDLYQTDWDLYYRVISRPLSVLTTDFSNDPNQSQ